MKMERKKRGRGRSVEEGKEARHRKKGEKEGRKEVEAAV